MTQRLTQAEVRRLLRGPKYHAVRTTCAAGHRHSSKFESRVCNRLQLECAESGATLFIGPSYPLLALAPDAKGKAQTWRPAFAVWKDGRLARIVEAKGKVTRDFTLRLQAFRATYPGVVVDVVTT